MTQKEDKELLLIDLCARLPYDVMVDYESHTYILNEIDPTGKDIDYITVRIQDIKRSMCAKNVMIESVKPYLRPLSSMTEEEAKELLFIRIDSKYDKSCANSIKLVEVSFQKKPPYKGSIFVWFSFENKIHDICSHTEYLGRTNDITLAEIDWLNAHHFDYRGLIEKGLAIDATGLEIY